MRNINDRKLRCHIWNATYLLGQIKNELKDIVIQNGRILGYFRVEFSAMFSDGSKYDKESRMMAEKIVGNKKR